MGQTDLTDGDAKALFDEWDLKGDGVIDITEYWTGIAMYVDLLIQLEEFAHAQNFLVTARPED